MLATPKLLSIYFCSAMKLLLFYSCLLAILLQAIFASTSLDGEGATLKREKLRGPKAKKVVGEPAGKEKAPKAKSVIGTGLVVKQNKKGTKAKPAGKKLVVTLNKKGTKTKPIVDKSAGKKSPGAKKKPLKKKSVGKRNKSRVVVRKDKPESLSELLPMVLVEHDQTKDVVVKENEPKFLSKLLPTVLFELIFNYFNDDTYPFIVYIHNWLLNDFMPRIAVDTTRLYMATDSEGLKGLNHSLASFKEDERRYVELGDPQWSHY